MVKTRVHDLAAEFGVSSERLLALLKEMNILVRSHLSALENDQVSAIRVRWEREKRKASEEPSAKKGRRKAAKAAAPEPAPVEAKPAKRRRTAAEVAVSEAEAQAEADRVAAEQLALERPVLEPNEPSFLPSLEERARALFKDLPPLPLDGAGSAGTLERPPARPSESSFSSPPGRTPVMPTRIQRPAPRSPESSSRSAGPSRGPRPVFSSSAPGGGPARPGGAIGPSTQERGRVFGPDAEKGGGRKRGKKSKRASVDQEAVQANILRTLQGMRGPQGRKGRGRDEPSFREMEAGRQAEEREREKTRIRVNEFISVSELADLMKVPASQIVQLAFKELGMMVTVNQRLDFDQIELISSEFGFQAVREEEYAAQPTAETGADEAPETLRSRPAVVTIMGHVDHGKTSLLDYIRKANVVAGEAGGITQHIGAYHVKLPDGRAITFLDTPGHQAFTAMRARGAQVTDIVVLVIAADDQVMPQTVEAISHARNAGVPMVVAINKTDLPTANIPKVKQDLLQQNVVLEEFGGNVLSTPISAKKGTNIDVLLEQVLLQAELLDLKANPDGRAMGAVLEATLDAGKGPLATILVQRGTLRVGTTLSVASSQAGSASSTTNGGVRSRRPPRRFRSRSSASRVSPRPATASPWSPTRSRRGRSPRSASGWSARPRIGAAPGAALSRILAGSCSRARSASCASSSRRIRAAPPRPWPTR